MTKNNLTLQEVLVLHQQGDLVAAKQGYLNILRNNPDNIEALHGMVLLAVEEDNLLEAQQYLDRALTLAADNPVLQLHLANILKGKGYYTQAIEVLKNTIQQFPLYAAAHNNLGTVLFKQGKIEEALAAYQRAIDLQPNYSDAYYNAGLALIKCHRIDEAKKTFQALLEFTSGHPGAQFQIGRIMLQQNNPSAAINYFEEIEKKYPYHFETQTNLATSYLKLGKLEEAKAHYLKALDINDQDTQVLFNLGVIDMQLGLFEAALIYYHRLLELDPNHFDAHHNLAFSYLTTNNKLEALKHFHAALRIQPHNKSIAHTIAILEGDQTVDHSPSEYVRALFDSYADHFDIHLKKNLQYRVPQALYQAMEPYIKTRHDLTILDMGCGTGLSGELFKPHAKSLIGVDLSTGMLKVATEKKLYDALYAADISSFLQDKQAIFDLILAGDVLVYFGDLKQLLIQVFSALTPGGYFVFNTEISKRRDFVLTSSGRFAHCREYIKRVSAQTHLTILKVMPIILRSQNHQDVPGLLYILQKPLG